MAKNGLLARLQRRLWLAAKAGPRSNHRGAFRARGSCVKTREPGQDPATRTFQALRIHVNAELEALEQGLRPRWRCWPRADAWSVISFHSLEDRIVKTFIARESRDVVDRRAPMAPPKPLRCALGRAEAGDGRGARQPARALGGAARGRAHRVPQPGHGQA
jgi:hypothetical protein